MSTKCLADDYGPRQLRGAGEENRGPRELGVQQFTSRRPLVRLLTAVEEKDEVSDSLLLASLLVSRALLTTAYAGLFKSLKSLVALELAVT
jgi:hypothetical protein